MKLKIIFLLQWFSLNLMYGIKSENKTKQKIMLQSSNIVRSFLLHTLHSELVGIFDNRFQYSRHLGIFVLLSIENMNFHMLSLQFGGDF